MLAADVRYAVRSLLRARGFALAVVVTLGLGIGATTAIFSVVRGVMLKPLPHREGGRLMYLRQSTRGPGGENVAFSVPEIMDFRSGSKALGGLGGVNFTAQTQALYLLFFTRKSIVVNCWSRAGSQILTVPSELAETRDWLSFEKLTVFTPAE